MQVSWHIPALTNRMICSNSQESNLWMVTGQTMYSKSRKQIHLEALAIHQYHPMPWPQVKLQLWLATSWLRGGSTTIRWWPAAVKLHIAGRAVLRLCKQATKGTTDLLVNAVYDSSGIFRSGVLCTAAWTLASLADWFTYAGFCEGGSRTKPCHHWNGWNILKVYMDKPPPLAGAGKHDQDCCFLILPAMVNHCQPSL